MKRTAPLLLLALALSPAATPQQADLRFRQAGEEFDFDTGWLRGKLRAGGRSLGLTGVVHVPTGRILSRSLGLFSHYRVFTANRRYGDAAWSWPSHARLRDDGAVEVHWPAATDRPFELRALYRWSAPDALDVETRVLAHSDLPAFESFLASYFAESFTISRVYAHGIPNAREPVWVNAELSDGIWQMFPRDPEAIQLIRDGRWRYPPSPVEWALRPMLAEPLGLRRAESWDLTAVVMAPRQDCFAVATPHSTEPHYSMYLSLFGRSIAAGGTARACARLLIRASLRDAEVPDLYRAYLLGLPRDGR